MCARALLVVRLLAILLLIFGWLPTTSRAGGWYLMVAPPKDSKGDHKPDLSWPLKFWDQRESFDSARACEKDRMRQLASHAALVAVASMTSNEKVDWEQLAQIAERWLTGDKSAEIPLRFEAPLARAVLDLKPGYLCIAIDDPRLK